ncbi:uncharacterized protein LOC143019758 [Oratosquilla oratoria]|uniref:uncharacterized protein LOC143019758 n=1 Tax=Oratosquilla oratoria TaxID=337810 RepID=UPI003F76D03E
MFVQTRRRKTENPMRTAAGRPPFLLLLGVVLGVWPLAHANSITVVLESQYCKKSTGERMVCNYTDATDEVILSAYPDGCNKWKTLELVGAKGLNVTASCFNQIIVSSSNELSLAVHPGEETKNPETSLHIRDSNVHSLEGAVGRLYINRSSVAFLSVSRVTDLNIKDSSVDSFDSVLNNVHDCLLSNTSIKSLDRLEVSGDKSLKMVGRHTEVLNKIKIEYGAIHRIVKGGIEVRVVRLVLMNVSIGSLEKEAIVITDLGRLYFKSCSINEAVFDSVSLRDKGNLYLMNTSVTGKQLYFFMRGKAEVYPFSMFLFEQFGCFSTISMVGSGFLGALMALLVALAVFLMSRRWRPGPCESDRDVVQENYDDIGPPEIYCDVNPDDIYEHVYEKVIFG